MLPLYQEAMCAFYLAQVFAGSAEVLWKAPFPSHTRSGRNSHYTAGPPMFPADLSGGKYCFLRSVCVASWPTPEAPTGRQLAGHLLGSRHRPPHHQPTEHLHVQRM